MFTILEAANSTAGMMSTVVMLVVMVVVFYFFMIRPENKKKKELEAMRGAIKVGDKITTIGGIIGTVVHVKDEKVVIETGADRVRIVINKWAVSTNDTAEAEKAAAIAASRKNRKEK